MGAKQNKSSQPYLARIIAVGALFVLLIIWGLISDNFWKASTWIELAKSLIPNLIGPLISIVVLYIIFFRRGIDIEKLVRTGSTDWLNKGYETFDKIDWGPYLRSSQKLVLVAFFFDEWITKNSDSIEAFLASPNARLVVYLPNYKNEELLEAINRIIPEHSTNQLSTKIMNSISELQRRCKDNTQAVSVNLYNNVFNYTYQLFDQNMFLQINELARQNEYKSPFIVLDLSRSKIVNSFFSRETTVLEGRSDRINLVTWKR